jgi:hypothetical protein
MDEWVYCWQSFVTSHKQNSAAEGVVLHTYGRNRVAQLFGVNDLNGRIDLKMNGSKAEGGVFTEELVTGIPC